VLGVLLAVLALAISAPGLGNVDHLDGIVVADGTVQRVVELAWCSSPPSVEFRVVWA